MIPPAIVGILAKTLNDPGSFARHEADFHGWMKEFGQILSSAERRQLEAEMIVAKLSRHGFYTHSEPAAWCYLQCFTRGDVTLEDALIGMVVHFGKAYRTMFQARIDALNCGEAFIRVAPEDVADQLD